MLSYDEIMDISKNYRYKYDSNTKNYTLINSVTKQPVQNSAETPKIQAALAAYQTLNSEKQLNSASVPQNPDERVQWEKDKLQELQVFLTSVSQKGTFTFDKILGQKITIGEHYFLEMINKDMGFFVDNTRQAKTENSKKLMEYLLAEQGKKMDDFSIQADKSGVKTHFSWNVKDMSFSEKLNPNSPQYSQPQKPQELSKEAKANRRAFTEELLTNYLMAETDSMYQDRVDNEDKNMRYAANAVNQSKEITVADKDLPKLMRLLLASKNISLDGQTDYFEQIISQPSISNALKQIRDSGAADKIKSIAEKNMSEGKLINGKLKGHNETKGELGLRIANRTIAKNPNFIDKAKNFISSRSKFSVNEQSDAIALSAVARTQGKIPSFEQKDNGTFEFNSDEEVTR